MSYQFYQFLHILGLLFLFFGFGMNLLQPVLNESIRSSVRKWVGALHGLGLLLLLVAGFGMLARLNIHWPWPGWVFGKFTIWLLLGFMIMPYKRNIGHQSFRILIVLVLGALAAYLAIYKPF